MQEIKDVLILGCGGIGGVIATYLAAQGTRVVGITRREEIAETIRTKGLVCETPAGRQTTVFEARAAAEGDIPASATRALTRGGFDLVIVAVPPNAVEAAVESALIWMGEHTEIVICANGLCEELAANLHRDDHIIGGVVSFGASMDGPAKVRQTSAGGFTLGRYAPGGTRPPHPESDAGLQAVKRCLSAVGPVEVTENLLGARWSKLAINCAISSIGTVADMRVGDMLKHRWIRRLCLETMSEVVEVAQAEGVQLKKVAGTLNLDWLALTESERARRLGSVQLVAKHGVLGLVGLKYRNLKSSMLAGIRRGRKPPIERLNGEIVERGRLLGIETPVNRALFDAVLAVSEGALDPGPAAIRSVARKLN